MSLDVDFEDKEGYALANIKGTATKSDLLGAFEKVFLYSSMKKASKMLVDLRGIENNMPIEEIAHISERFNNIQSDYEGLMENQVIFAFLINKEGYNPALINDSLYSDREENAYVSVNYEEAEKWLLSKEEKILQLA